MKDTRGKSNTDSRPRPPLPKKRHILNIPENWQLFDTTLQSLPSPLWHLTHLCCAPQSDGQKQFWALAETSARHGVWQRCGGFVRNLKYVVPLRPISFEDGITVSVVFFWNLNCFLAKINQKSNSFYVSFAICISWIHTNHRLYCQTAHSKIYSLKLVNINCVYLIHIWMWVSWPEISSGNRHDIDIMIILTQNVINFVLHFQITFNLKNNFSPWIESSDICHWFPTPTVPIFVVVFFWKSL